ncbi:carbonyl reductase [NADPH] 2-like [Tetranychus urticae]|uniref:carbonyl reductase [NADPH] 2-like n=1 Tax=Tetranychus urticae TaxID=32264 RepID=UPI00077B92A7|nr:carbonyl reductase [NADPH] 2-like [Tetranychus urticae]
MGLELFSSLGAKVAIVGRDQTKLDKVAAECETKSPQHYKPVVIKADFIREEDVVRTFEETISVYKTLDILINNAAIPAHKGFGEPDAMADYDRVQQVNVRAVVRLTELAAPHLKETKGAIVNVSSVAGIKPFPATWSYCMSKAALDMFTKCMAGKLAPHVRVNTVSPGGVLTSFARDRPDPEAFRARLAEMHPMQRLAEPVDLANVIAFLASDAARNMTGSIVVSDSGMLVADPYAK